METAYIKRLKFLSFDMMAAELAMKFPNVTLFAYGVSGVSLSARTENAETKKRTEVMPKTIL